MSGPDGASLLGGSGRVAAMPYLESAQRAHVKNLQRMADEGSYFEDHNVPSAYRGLSVEGVTLDKKMVFAVLQSVDPLEDLRDRTAIVPELVALLALPVQMAEGPKAPVALDVITVNAVMKLHEELGQAVRGMKKLPEPPVVNDYLEQIGRIVQAQTRSGGGSTTVGSSSGGGAAGGSRGSQIARITFRTALERWRNLTRLPGMRMNPLFRMA